MAWKRRLCCKVEMNTTFIFLVHNGWTRKPCTAFLGWEVCQVSEARILNKSWFTAEFLVKGSQKSWERTRSMPPHISEQQSRARGRNNSCWSWDAQNSSLGQEVWCSLISNASDHTANRVPGNYISLRNNSRWLCQTVGFLRGWATNCEWWIAQEGEGHSANILTAVGGGQADNKQSPGVTTFLSFNYIVFPNCLNMFLSSSPTPQNSNSSAPLFKDMTSCGEVLLILKCSGDMMYFPRLLGEVPVGGI